MPSHQLRLDPDLAGSDGLAQRVDDDRISELLDELGPLPVLLLNVTRFEPQQDEVNFIVTGEAHRRDGVRLLDWATAG